MVLNPIYNNGIICLILVILSICGVLFGYAFNYYTYPSEGFYITFTIGVILTFIALWLIKLTLLLRHNVNDNYVLLSESNV